MTLNESHFSSGTVITHVIKLLSDLHMSRMIFFFTLVDCVYYYNEIEKLQL